MTPVNMLDDGTVIERTDACLGVRFFWLAIENELKSKEEGRPVCDQVEMVEIITPGSKDKFHGKVNDFHKMRFRDRYKAFSERACDKMQGTLLEQFPFISAADRKELEYFNVFTGEQLINMPDGNIERLGVNGRDLIKKVTAYMQMAKDTSVVARMTEENENLKREMALIREQMNIFLKMKEDAKYEEAKTTQKVGGRDKDTPSVEKGREDDGKSAKASKKGS